MLQSLHVKNLALIEEAELEFQEGLNILTGETGAGKSVLIGSINLALGGKFDKEMLRTGADSALVELTFSGNPKVLNGHKALENHVSKTSGSCVHPSSLGASTPTYTSSPLYQAGIRCPHHNCLEIHQS